MSARRSLLFWWGAGALLLVLLAAWVFHASLVQERKPRSSFGSNGWDRPEDRSKNGFPPVDVNNPANNPGLDPHVQETLRTINEINRINKVNQDLRNKLPTAPEKLSPPPAVPLKKLPQSNPGDEEETSKQR